MSRKKKTARDKSTRQLMGIDSISEYGIRTPFGELAYFFVRPTNISVLSESGVSERIRALLGVLQGETDAEILALDSAETFDSNKRFYHSRADAEELPAVRALLEKDTEHLDSIQTQMVSAREFCIIARLRDVKESERHTLIPRLEKSIKDSGFTVRSATSRDVRRLLGIYYEQNAAAENYGSVDGEHFFSSSDFGDLHPHTREGKLKDFLDMIAPSIVKFNADHYILGNTYRCVWALREYPTMTDEQAILRHLGEKHGVTLRIYTRKVGFAEEKKILHNAGNKHRLSGSNTNDLRQTVVAENNLRDVAAMIGAMQRSREALLHCAVYIELTAQSLEALRLLQAEVQSELVRSKLGVDKLLLRQQQGFLSVNPAGHNAFGVQFERVLPASSAANLYPMSYSGKTDPRGIYIGRDRYGSNVVVDFDQRDEDKTSANILILGNTGQGKSYLTKLLMLNLLESGKSLIALDAEHEQEELCEAAGGCFVDLTAGKYRINPLEPKCWHESDDTDDAGAPEAFRESTLLAQHISWLKDFFRSYKEFSDSHIDTIEIMVSKLYAKWGISSRTDFTLKRPEEYPILSDLYDLIEGEYKGYGDGQHLLYTEATLQEILLGLHSMCKGADAQFFNGHTNITSNRFLVFGVKDIIRGAKNVCNAMLFSVLSYMSDKLLVEGNTVAVLDELHIWLGNPTAVEYIRNCLKRVRKKESAILMASQNIEDFDQASVREMTRPLFGIPQHQFLFNAGTIDKRTYMDLLQLDDAEYELIRHAPKGVCLYKCGSERYLLEVHAPPYKERLFGTAGGR